MVRLPHKGHLSMSWLANEKVLIEDSGWAELLRSFGTQRSAGIKYVIHGITFTIAETGDCPPVLGLGSSLLSYTKDRTYTVFLPPSWILFSHIFFTDFVPLTAAL